MKNILATSLMIVSVILMQGCATIVSGRSQEVTFQSTPDEATVKINGRPIGKTPLTVELKKEKGQTLIFEKKGYKPFTTEMSTSMNPMFWGNIVLGGLLGSTTDGVTGAIIEYSPNQYMVTLTPEDNSDGMLNEIQEVKRYVVINFEELKKDASDGGYTNDDTFTSLLKLLKIQSDDKKQVTAVVGVLKKQEDAVKAAKAIAQAFIQ